MSTLTSRIEEDVITHQVHKVERRSLHENRSSGLSLRRAPRRSGCPRSLQAIAFAENSAADGGDKERLHRNGQQQLSERRRSTILEASSAIQNGEGVTGNSHILDSRSTEKPPSPQRAIRSDHIRKAPRRRTIYVPSDDTTITTIHPGKHALDATDIISIPAIGNDSTSLKEEGLTPAHPKRRFSLIAAPKRGPLQMCLNTVDEGNDKGMRVNGSIGKENIRPGDTLRDLPAMSGHIKFSRPQPRRLSTAVLYECDRSMQPPRFVERSNGIQQDSHADVHCVPSLIDDTKNRRRMSISTAKPRRLSIAPERRNSTMFASQPEVTSRITSQIPGFSASEISVASRNLWRAHPIEEHWLSDLEMTMKELLNQLYAKAGLLKTQTANDMRESKAAMASIARGADCSLIQKRLTASLMFGTLSPQHNTKMVPRPDLDVGLRSDIISFWQDTYDVQILLYASEIILRLSEAYCATVKNKALDCIDSIQLGRNEVGAISARQQRKGFEKMFNAIMITEDPVDRTSETGSWHRTMFVSLMMILLVDKAKVAGRMKMRVFQTSTNIKSSTAALERLASLLCPTTTNLNRRLKSLGFLVSHVQTPESEYSHEIKNLALDLRDGVRLKKLIEILAYSSRSIHHARLDHTMAENGVFTFPQTKETLSRQQQVDNVWIVLQNVKAMPGFGVDANNYTPEDIVDGHREKSMSLLWSLVGTVGLEFLVDLKDLSLEIKRLDRKLCGQATHQEPYPENFHLSGVPRAHHALGAWANAASRLHPESDASRRSAGLSTDSRLFHAIMDEYSPYLFQHQGSMLGETNLHIDAIHLRLMNIGCSRAFGEWLPFEHLCTTY